MINNNINNMINNNINNMTNISKINENEIIKQKFKIYENQKFSLLNEIELEKESILSAIELDNKDLIITSYSNNIDVNINIYQYKNNNYMLYQKIKEKFVNKIIKKLSGNRFMTTSKNILNINIYSLNKKNLYEVSLSHEFKVDKSHIDNIDIYEIDQNNFIFCILESTPNTSVYQNYNDIHAYRDIFDYTYKIKKITFNKEKPSTTVLFKFQRKIHNINSTEYVILKKKYFIIGVEDILYIFSIKNGKQLKKYTFLENGEKNTNLYTIKYYKIYKWNCSDDDEFITNMGGNITLFKLEEKEKENEIINLKIINYSYIEDGKCLIKMNENNQFFIQYDYYILIY
jgi:hypothetical protein